jgi:hypothetical protein
MVKKSVSIWVDSSDWNRFKEHSKPLHARSPNRRINEFIKAENGKDEGNEGQTSAVSLEETYENAKAQLRASYTTSNKIHHMLNRLEAQIFSEIRNKLIQLGTPKIPNSGNCPSLSKADDSTVKKIFAYKPNPERDNFDENDWELIIELLDERKKQAALKETLRESRCKLYKH